jgi:protein-tyrosine phosphatase
MAAALFRHALGAETGPLRDLEVISAGLSAQHGCPASANAVQALQKVGISLGSHRSQRLTPELVQRALAVFCMTEGHRASIELQFEPPAARLHLVREFLQDGEREIDDPFGMGLACYEASRDSMVEAIPSILNYLRPIAAPPAATGSAPA